LRTLFCSMADCVKSVDRQGRVLDMNPAGLRMVAAKTLDDVKGETATKLIAAPHHARFQDAVRRVFRGESVSAEYEVVALDGTRRWMHQVAIPFRDPNGDGSVTEMLAVTRDITDRMHTLEDQMRLREQAIEASHAKSEFLANMSHEIRTPLNGVLGMAQLLRRTDLDEQQKRYLDTLLSSGEALLGVISDVLDLSRIEAGMMRLQPGPVNLPGLMQTAVNSVRGTARLKGLEVLLDVDPALEPDLNCDEKRLRQILLNLAGNAVKFTDCGEVRLEARLSADQRWVQISVSDSGPGIAAADQERIFERFSQGQSDVARLHEGSGLGLAISRELAHLMGGRVEVHSTLGEGATFTLTLPYVRYVSDAPERAGTQPETVVLKDGRPIKVLLVEDNPTNLEVMCEHLTACGCTVFTARDGMSGVSGVCDAENVDVVLLDLHMPGMSGEDTMKRLQALDCLCSRSPICFVTADVSVETRDRLLDQGAKRVLHKPLDLDTLYQTVLELSGAHAVAMKP